MKKYTYNKQDYFSEYALRNAIFNNERKVFGEITTDAEWKKLGVTVSEYKEPEKTLDEQTLEELQKEQTDLNAQIEQLKDQLLVATLVDDTEQIESIKAQYQTLVGGE